MVPDIDRGGDDDEFLRTVAGQLSFGRTSSAHGEFPYASIDYTPIDGDRLPAESCLLLSSADASTRQRSYSSPSMDDRTRSSIASCSLDLALFAHQLSLADLPSTDEEAAVHQAALHAAAYAPGNFILFPAHVEASPSIDMGIESSGRSASQCPAGSLERDGSSPVNTQQANRASRLLPLSLLRVCLSFHGCFEPGQSLMTPPMHARACAGSCGMET
nr:unnamed protein product [Digitaria exilis]